MALVKGAAGTWLKYCRYGFERNQINQSITRGKRCLYVIINTFGFSIYSENG